MFGSRNRLIGNGLFSGLLLVVALAASAWASIAGRWSPIAALYAAPAAILWAVWFVHFIWFSTRRWCPGRRAVRVLVALGLVFACIVGSVLLSGVGPALRTREIAEAVRKGLQKDCAALLQDWPTEEDRIHRTSPEFEKLPQSIQMLSPVYVTKQVDAEIPKHIGLCTCGFGGVAMGIRVFRDDQDAQVCIKAISGSYQRIAPGVYFCQHET